MSATETITTGDRPRVLLLAMRALVSSQQVATRADVACCGMTVAQAATLRTLAVEGPSRLGALSERLGVTPSTLTRNVERMEERGWVERVPDPDDGRAWRLRLSPSGRRQARDLERQDERLAEALLESLPPERRERAVDGLLDLLDAIDRLTGSCCPDRFSPIHDFVEAHRRASEDRP